MYCALIVEDLFCIIQKYVFTNRDVSQPLFLETKIAQKQFAVVTSIHYEVLYVNDTQKYSQITGKV